MATEKTTGISHKNVVRRHARERHALPKEDIKIPPPKPTPQAPGKPNLLMMLPTIGMALVSGGMGYYRASQSSSSPWQTALFTLLPMLVMGMLTMFVQMWIYSNSQKKYQTEVSQQEADYKQRLDKLRERLETHVSQQQAILNKESPSMGELVRRVSLRDKRLWERQPNDNDFLSVRLGTGELPISVTIRAPEEDEPHLRPARQLATDFQFVDQLPIVANLYRLGTVGVRGVRPSESLYLVFTMIANLATHHSPDEVFLYVISHRADAVQVWNWLRWLPHTRGEQPGMSRLSLATGETDEEVLLELSQLLRQRGDEKRPSRRTNPHLVVIFDQTPGLQGHPVIGTLLEYSPREEMNKLQASAIFIENPIPSQVNAMIMVQGMDLDYRETWGSDASQVRYRGKAELATPKQMEQLARSMAPLRTEASYNAGGGNLPSSVRLIELLGATQPEEVDLNKLYSWVYDPKRVMAFPVGYNVDLKPQMVVLREAGQGGHGSHAMLAGMTGTGKSVLLQAIVLSLALTNSPAHLNFILADFKGGASELAKLQGLPHIAGFVTDLNPAMVERFRISLEGEILRRKTMFDMAKETLGQPVANIRTYNKLCPDIPLPHLVVLLDEFAHGLQINPNFRSAIDTIAAQGRALGVHLVLSTQRATDFDAKIRPNVEIRLSLRVASREDSKAMFNRDEAFTRLNRPGQAYLQVGDNEVFEMFQAARADIPYQPEGTVNLDLLDAFTIYQIEADGRRKQLPLYEHKTEKRQEEKPGVIAVSEAEMLVEQVRTFCQSHYPSVRQICLPPLPVAESVSLMPLIANHPVYRRWQGQSQWAAPDLAWRLRLPVGLLDLPEQQAQQPYVLDFNQGDGNFLVVGPTGSGKILFLRRLLSSLIETHSPADVNLYILGRGPGLALFETLPHCQGNLIRATESERLGRMFTFLQEEISRRRNLMRQMRTDTMGALRQVDPTLALPALFLIIEDYARFKADYENSQSERLAQVQSFVQEGKSVDLHVIVSSADGKSVNRLLDNLQNRLVLGTNGDLYQIILGRRLELPPEIPGRGYTVVDQMVLECQIASPMAAVSQDARIAEMSQKWVGYRPMPILTLPEQVELTWLWQAAQEKPAQYDFVMALQENGRSDAAVSTPTISIMAGNGVVTGSMTAPLGVNFDLMPVNYDLLGSTYSLIIGPGKCGKTGMLLSLVLAAAMRFSPAQLEVIVLDFKPPYGLQLLAGLPQVRYASQAKQAKAYLTELLNRFEAQGESGPMSPTPMAGMNRYTLILIDDWFTFQQKGDGELFKLIDSCVQKGLDAGLKMILADTSQNMKQVSQKATTMIQVKQPNGTVMNSSYSIGFVPAAYNCGRGIVFTADQNEAQPFALPTRTKMTPQQLLQIKLNKGRAFLLEQDEGAMVQFARVGGENESEVERGQRLKELIAQIVTGYRLGERERMGETAVADTLLSTSAIAREA